MNLPPHQATRGPGSFQAAVAIQHILDHVAAVTGLDPCLVRERNFLRPSPPPPSMGFPAADVSNREHRPTPCSSLAFLQGGVSGCRLSSISHYSENSSVHADMKYPITRAD